MKKAIMILLVGLIVVSSLIAQEHRTNHYTQVTIYFAMESLSQDFEPQKYMQKHIYAQAFIKTIMERTDTTMNLHQHAFGPFKISDDPLRDSILSAEGPEGMRTLSYRAWYGMKESITDTNNPIYHKIKAIKDLTGAKVLTIVILTNYKYYISHTEANSNILIINNENDEWQHLRLHNQIIFDETSTKAKGFVGQLPEGHPYYGNGDVSTLLTWYPNVYLYPRKGLYLDRWGFWVPVGDDDHNVLDPDHGWKLHYLYNKGELDYAGFQTRSDTLTIQQGINRHIELYPGWNDENVGKVLYSAGGNFYNVQPIFTNEYHCRYYQRNSAVGPEDLGGYAVEIPHLGDAFALEYILVRYIDGLVIPGISVPTDIKLGEDFTVTLTGTPQLMTSWIPEITITGVDAQLISVDNWSYTYRPKTSGQMQVTLHHNSLQVLPDTTVSRTVVHTSVAQDLPSTFDITPIPAVEYIEVTLNTNNQKYSETSTIEIYNNKAEIMLKTTISNASNKHRINIESLSAGIYFVKIDNETKKFIKK